MVWDFLSTALKSNSDKSLSHQCTTMRESWDALPVSYGSQSTVANSDLSRHHNSFNIAPQSDLLEEMRRIEDLAQKRVQQE